MITTERLAEIEAAPREASIFKAEAKELADAYRERLPGLRIERDANQMVWLHIESPTGKKAHISMDGVALKSGPVVQAAVVEWLNAL